jgi:hypothetical protein
MKHLTICTFTIVAFFAATSSLWWRSYVVEEATASVGAMSTVEFQMRIGAKRLHNEETSEPPGFRTDEVAIERLVL